MITCITLCLDFQRKQRKPISVVDGFYPFVFAPCTIKFKCGCLIPCYIILIRYVSPSEHFSEKSCCNILVVCGIVVPLHPQMRESGLRAIRNLFAGQSSLT